MKVFNTAVAALSASALIYNVESALLANFECDTTGGEDSGDDGKFTVRISVTPAEKADIDGNDVGTAIINIEASQAMQWIGIGLGKPTKVAGSYAIIWATEPSDVNGAVGSSVFETVELLKDTKPLGDKRATPASTLLSVDNDNGMRYIKISVNLKNTPTQFSFPMTEASVQGFCAYGLTQGTVSGGGGNAAEKHPGQVAGLTIPFKETSVGISPTPPTNAPPPPSVQSFGGQGAAPTGAQIGTFLATVAGVIFAML